MINIKNRDHSNCYLEYLHGYAFQIKVQQAAFPVFFI